MLGKFLASSAAVVVLAAAAAGPALADPPPHVTVHRADVSGVGSDTSQYLFDQFGVDYDAPHHTGPQLYSWDTTGSSISTKSGCTAITRPGNTSTGITDLASNTRIGRHYCIDYVRAGRPRLSTDPAYTSGGVAFTELAGDAVTWASFLHSPDTPASLTAAQLTGIYSCRITNWRQAGGRNARIQPFLPGLSADITKVFLDAIGLVTPGSCVNTTSVQPEEGVSPALNSPAVIVPYSVGDYIAQDEHSAACTHAGCSPPGCTPSGSQNKFGCDETGYLQINKINGTSPAVPWPLTATSTVSAGFPAGFQYPVSAVVRFNSTRQPIPAYLRPFFGRGGWICTSLQASTDIAAYGFRNVGSACGTTS